MLWTYRGWDYRARRTTSIVAVMFGQAWLTARGVATSAAFVPLWSSGAVAATFGLAQMSPQAFLVLRAAGTAAGTWLLVALTRQHLPTQRALRTTVVAGMLLQIGYQGFFFLSLALGISPALLAIVVSAQPLLTCLGHRQRDARTITGVLVGMSGVAIAVSGGLSTGRVSASAVAAALAALASISLGTALQARQRSAGIWASLAVQWTVSFAAFTVVVGVIGPGHFAPTAAAVASVGWLIVVVSIAATALMYRIAQTHGAMTISALMLLVPVTTAIEDFVVRGTPWVPAILIGGAVTTSGLALVLPGAGTRPTDPPPLGSPR